jgi:hypothetical protein
MIRNEEVQPLLEFQRTKKQGGIFVALEHAENKMIQRKNRRQSLVGLKPGQYLRFLLPVPQDLNWREVYRGKVPFYMVGRREPENKVLANE